MTTQEPQDQPRTAEGPTTAAGREHVARWQQYRTEATAAKLWTEADQAAMDGVLAAIPAIETEAAASALRALREQIDGYWPNNRPDATLSRSWDHGAYGRGQTAARILAALTEAGK